MDALYLRFTRPGKPDGYIAFEEPEFENEKDAAVVVTFLNDLDEEESIGVTHEQARELRAWLTRLLAS